ncbi:type 1 fimbrial protein [Enterobacteriaceae bacterium H18W14]|uniref:fimbrial protein n=1 Tax=Dryocola boscaweniae TaxID=2925397 RepID=UPI0022F064C9|nr:fimbrial protein [Dryocola boscaweniae]MCT4715254.1 type 1 fimbrial protein [Dryocola boscaweniae]
MKGTIVESACSIATSSLDQTVTIAGSPVSKIINNSLTPGYDFSIVLVHCLLEKFNHRLSAQKYFSITFDGDDDAGLFGVHGEAKGIALKISDANGNVAVPGEVLPEEYISPETRALKYILREVRDGKALQPGYFYAAIRFKIDYL